MNRMSRLVLAVDVMTTMPVTTKPRVDPAAGYAWIGRRALGCVAPVRTMLRDGMRVSERLQYLLNDVRSFLVALVSESGIRT